MLDAITAAGAGLAQGTEREPQLGARDAMKRAFATGSVTAPDGRAQRIEVGQLMLVQVKFRRPSLRARGAQRRVETLVPHHAQILQQFAACLRLYKTRECLGAVVRRGVRHASHASRGEPATDRAQ